MKAGRRGPRAHFACRPWLVALLLSSGVGAAPDEARRFWRARGGPWAPCGSCGLRVAGGGEMWLPIQRAALPKPPSRGWDAGRRVAGVSRSPSEVLSPRGMRGDGCLCLLVSYNASCAFCVVVSLVLTALLAGACGFASAGRHLRICADRQIWFCSETARAQSAELGCSLQSCAAAAESETLAAAACTFRVGTAAAKRCQRTARSARRSA